MLIVAGAVAIIVVFALLIFGSAIRILREYERGVVFTLGRYTAPRDRVSCCSCRWSSRWSASPARRRRQVPSQDVISRDNVSVKVSAVIYFRVIDAERAVIQVKTYMEATSQLAQTTLRSVLGKHDLDEMLAERDKLNVDIQDVLDKQTDAWASRSRTSRSSASTSTIA